MSDYNLLQPDDKRIKEVTELGLQYNLLTNYTSFIAVDSEVRNKDGKSTTVKQPLPLPQGVPDYAVGTGYAAASAPSPMMLSRGKAAAESAGDMYLMQSNKPEKKDKRAATLKIGNVAATGGLTKDAVRKSAEKQLASVRSCLATSQPGTTMTITLLVDANGAVKKVTVAGSGIKDKAVLECLQRMMKAWRFDPTSAGKETEAEITVQIG